MGVFDLKRLLHLANIEIATIGQVVYKFDNVCKTVK